MVWANKAGSVRSTGHKKIQACRSPGSSQEGTDRQPWEVEVTHEVHWDGQPLRAAASKLHFLSSDGQQHVAPWSPQKESKGMSPLCPDTLPGPCILLPYSSPLTGIQNPSPKHCLFLTFATCLINSPKAELSFRCTCPILYLQVNFQHSKRFSNQSFFRFFQQIFQVSKREKLRIKFSLFIDSLSLHQGLLLTC